MRNKRFRNCATCGKEFLLRASQVKNCSYSCRIIWRKTVLIGKNSANWQGGIKHSYYQRHPELVYIKNQKRRKALSATEGAHTYQEWLELKLLYKYMCLCCKRQEPEIKLTEDHIIPLSKGGSNQITNIQPLCLSCNVRKFTKIQDYRTSRLTTS